MKVLVAHNFYRTSAPSGENRVVEEEMRLLNGSPGIEAVPFFRSSDEVSEGRRAMLSVGARTAYARPAVLRLQELLRIHRPSVLHVHNVYPLLSPAVLRVAHKAGVAVVHTVHNYRHSCIAGTHFRNGRVCTDCVGRALPWPSVAHSCYRGSAAQSLAMACGTSVSAGAWDSVDAWIALTPFMADHLIRVNGVPSSLISLRPTWVERHVLPPVRPSRRLLFLGRLDEAKGVRLLLDAWSRVAKRDLELCVAGAGPLADEVASRCAGAATASFLGEVRANDVPALLQSAAALVVPSLWYEGFPRVVVEAMSHGRPSIVSDQGSLATIVDTTIGWRFDPTPDGLMGVLDGLSRQECMAKGVQAKRRYEQAHTPAVAAASLLEIYDGAIARASYRAAK